MPNLHVPKFARVIARQIVLVLVTITSAAFVVLAVTVAIAGRRDTVDQVSFIILRVETAMWPAISRVISLVKREPSRAESEVWAAVVSLESQGVRGSTIAIAVDTQAMWPSYERESFSDVNERVVTGWAPGNPGTPEAAAAVADFVQRNERPVFINCHALPRNCICVPRRAFDRDLHERDGWEQFSRQNHDVRQFTTVSRVGFNSRGTLAVLYAQSSCGALCGGGGYFVFRRIAGKWVFYRYHEKWVS